MRFRSMNTHLMKIVVHENNNALYEGFHPIARHTTTRTALNLAMLQGSKVHKTVMWLLKSLSPFWMSTYLAKMRRK